VATVVISLPPGRVHVGDRVRLIAKAEDKVHQLVVEDIRWQSGDGEIASVSLDGVLTANAPGSALVWAEAQGIRAAARIDVAPAVVAAVTIPGAPAFVEVGRPVDVSAVPLDAQNNPLVGRSIAWESGDPRIATVSREGRVEAHDVGSVRLIC